MAISSSPAGRCGILDSKHWRGRFSTCNLANFLLLLAPKGGRFVSCAAKATAVKVAGAPVSQNLKELEDEEESEGSFSSPPDSVSIASDRYDKDDEGHSDGNLFPPIACQDLQFVLKAGYLEKRRKDHSFLGFEWQKRWCVISKTVFYYYGSDKDKQQKGEFALEGYTIRMNNNLRKDAKKDCCFEISAPDKRIYQFAAATPKEAEEWVQQVKFVIQDMESNTIPEEEEEYDDVGQASSEPIDDSIYEELPEESAPPKSEVPRKWSQEKVTTVSDGKNTDYANFYQGLWDCTGDVPDELSFKRGDVIYILSKEKSALEIKSGVQLQFTDPTSGRRFCRTRFVVSVNVVRSLPCIY
uniref:Src kinase associated phosphoprotein 2 n=1 Tax=Anser cygnoides TaxID=8845 RepID=A0A8B9EAK3_ANSCY